MNYFEVSQKVKKIEEMEKILEQIKRDVERLEQMIHEGGHS